MKAQTLVDLAEAIRAGSSAASSAYQAAYELDGTLSKRAEVASKMMETATEMLKDVLSQA